MGEEKIPFCQQSRGSGRSVHPGQYAQERDVLETLRGHWGQRGPRKEITVHVSLRPNWNNPSQASPTARQCWTEVFPNEWSSVLVFTELSPFDTEIPTSCEIIRFRRTRTSKWWSDFLSNTHLLYGSGEWYAEGGSHTATFWQGQFRPGPHGACGRRSEVMVHLQEPRWGQIRWVATPGPA